MNLNRHICWVDGVNSAVMAHFVLKQNPTVMLAHCDLGDSVHPDSRRFIDDLEIWYDREIVRLKSERYSNVDEVFEHRRYLAKRTMSETEFLLWIARIAAKQGFSL